MKKVIVESLFQRSVKSFYDCIESEENFFLENEINLALKSLIPAYESINITLPLENCFEHFHVEVTMKLLSSDGNSVGKYSYIENEEGVAIDDFLSFE